MNRSFQLIGLTLALAVSGCAGNKAMLAAGGAAEPGNTRHLGYSVTVHSALVLSSEYQCWPPAAGGESSGYFLPPGVYYAENEDTNGVFFRAPDGFKLLAEKAPLPAPGGIYLPKVDTIGVRGHVYLQKPGAGDKWTSYPLPEEFFSSYVKMWTIAPTNQLPRAAAK